MQKSVKNTKQNTFKKARQPLLLKCEAEQVIKLDPWFLFPEDKHVIQLRGADSAGIGAMLELSKEHVQPDQRVCVYS